MFLELRIVFACWALMCVYLPFADVQYIACVFVVLWLPDDGYNE
jgi:hypothetical protein